MKVLITLCEEEVVQGRQGAGSGERGAEKKFPSSFFLLLLNS
jgi:hypothetical protein